MYMQFLGKLKLMNTKLTNNELKNPLKGQFCGGEKI